MSAFLGPIHHLLYGKMMASEALLRTIIESIPNGHMLQTAAEEQFGSPITAPLEDVIDTGNIHGWLQTHIESVELRTAFVITEAISKAVITKEALGHLYTINAAEAQEKLPLDATPEDVFRGLQNILLDGMPCDRVNLPLEATSDALTWQRRVNIQKPYWEAVGGDLDLLHFLRFTWLKAFTPSHLALEMLMENVYKLTRREL